MIGNIFRGFRLHKTPASRIRGAKIALRLMPWLVIFASPAMTAQVIANPQGPAVSVQERDGTYEIQTAAGAHAVIQARVAAEIDHKWVRSTDYPKHEVLQTTFTDALGRGKTITVTSSGIANFPNLAYRLQIYDGQAFGVVEVEVENQTTNSVTIQSLRSLEAIGDKIIDLDGTQTSDRVLSDSFSEDWPPLQIYDLGKALQGMHRAVGSQLIYNRESKESLFIGALTSDRFLTIIHLQTHLSPPSGSGIASFTVDSTGTTEIQASDPESGLREGPAENLIELNVPLAADESITSEPVMFAAGKDYHSQLENYGAAIRKLHHSRIAAENMLGWWSWTAFYTKITQGAALTNAEWLAEHLKTLGYDYFHFDLGYAYSRSEYATPNAS
ncbi:MAG: hypothetical protein WB814_03790, partial [Candidatus Sulfotelmatobacter sp.]